ncbi:hypothetical protein [Shimia abyssi]|uniref:Uncharacterized protein n=1 Tax=Shimia abyssi TaxID=1662395 RepID=A0A2P8FCA7_9RHOB|nr:hypothetical protein [Shimia abyssi]PSL19344.1 hypothetical protein CLV88_10656 [Shimia abyssi]
MKTLWRWVRRLVLVLLVAVIGLASPVIYVETMCRGDGDVTLYAPQLAAEHHRPEARTLMTYPEWHIVHAYEDYAKVIETGDPHEFGYLRAIGGFWSSLCVLSKASADLGPVDGGTKQMVHVIGVSFTAELLMKAAYEETLGRIAAALRGAPRAPLDDLSADQAAKYARFLQQTPWYQWPFETDATDLKSNNTGSLRDRERAIALGLEYSAKAAYARAIAQAVAQVGPDELTLRMIVTGLDAPLPETRIMRQTPSVTEIETPRYRTLTHLMVGMAMDDVDFVEIAGNDDILFTALSGQPTVEQALLSLPRQGFGDYRHLIMIKVTDLADQLRNLDASGLTLEHVHDY